MAHHRPSWPKAHGHGRAGLPFWVLELGSGLISSCNKEMTLDTKKLGGPGRLVPRQWDPEQTQTDMAGGGVPVLLLYTVVMTIIMTMSSCRISEVW